jgi:AhpD family alkylhydroperoxidase
VSTLGLIEYKDATPEVRAVYDDIMATRKTDWVNNFWKAIAHDPATLKRTWEDIKQIMAPGALDPLTKELVYLAVSVSNQCGYCIASHTAGARGKGMTDAMFKELMAVVGVANETNKVVSGYQVEIDEDSKRRSDGLPPKGCPTLRDFQKGGRADPNLTSTRPKCRCPILARSVR